MAYDSLRHNVVLFGGHTTPMSTSIPALGDTWTWDGKDWNQQQPSVSPSPRAGQVVFDGALGVAVLLGGSATSADQYNDMWAWNGLTWSKLAVTLPTGWSSAAAAYDDATTSIVAVPCSSSVSVPTFVFDGKAWHQYPSGSLHTCKPALAYDAKRSLVVLFGGNTGQISNSTWTWDGSSWVQKSALHNPPARFQPAAGFDGAADLLMIFGGLGSLGAQNVMELADTWAWNGNDWSQVAG
jgi:hypothetical protein